MNAQLLCLLALVSADPADTQPIRVHSPSPIFATAMRGQSPADIGQPPGSTPQYGYPADPATAPIPTPTFAQPMQVSQMVGSPPPYTGGDPFITAQPGMATPFAANPYGASSYSFNTLPPASYQGTIGPEPIRYGWSSKYDVGYIADSGADSPFGDFNVFEFDAQWKRTWMWPWDSAFSWSPEFNYRSWSGPGGLPLPGSVYRFASDLQLATSVSGPFSLELGFTPQVASDLSGSSSSDAWMWDARAAMFIRMGPHWTWALGIQYWDRVDDLIIPYAGFVWRPDERWEFTIVLPKPRIDYFIGYTVFGPTWFYGRGEYHVEAYDVELQGLGVRDRTQIGDYRALLGFRNFGPCASGFIEAGWIFNRDIKFETTLPDVGIDSGFITRLGLRF